MIGNGYRKYTLTVNGIICGTADYRSKAEDMWDDVLAKTLPPKGGEAWVVLKGPRGDEIRRHCMR